MELPTYAVGSDCFIVISGLDGLAVKPSKKMTSYCFLGHNFCLMLRLSVLKFKVRKMFLFSFS